ncbi:MAG: class I SAM-dependent methyltransferase [Streptosporangiaceae bacterium]
MSSKTLARFIDPNQPGSLTHGCRQHRNEEFKRRFPDLADMRVLDLGGTAASWRSAGLRAASVTLVNLDKFEEAEEPWMQTVRGDACAGGFGHYDLVFSNSLLEHLGGHTRRQQFADVVRESAPAWWVQTPYRYFPVEPHWVFPWFQFLPFRTRLLITQHWSLGHQPVLKDQAQAAELVASVELVSATEMKAYFAGSEIWFERFAGLPKSLVAIKTGSC